MDRPREETKAKEGQDSCRCPFCDNAMEMPYPFCQACGSEIEYCEACGQPLPAGAEFCPYCAEEE